METVDTEVESDAGSDSPVENLVAQKMGKKKSEQVIK